MRQQVLEKVVLPRDHVGRAEVVCDSLGDTSACNAERERVKRPS